MTSTERNSTSTSALLKKLKSSCTQLIGLDQDRIDTATLTTVRKELVKAYATWCPVNILRLLVPDPPYTLK